MSGRALSVAMLAAIQAGTVRPVLFYQGEFSGGTLRLWSGLGTRSWNGYSWTGAGELLGVSPVQEMGDLSALNFTVSLTGSLSSILSVALGEMKSSTGLPGKIWLGAFGVGASPNYALRFDGANSYAQIANDATLQPLTGDWSVEFWITPKGSHAGDYPQIIGSRPWTAGLDKGWAVCIHNSAPLAIGVHMADGSSGFDVTADWSTTATAVDTKQHWVVVFDRANGQVKFYLNGVLDVTRSKTFPSGSVNQANDIYIGREIGGGNNRRLNAELDGMRVYARALSAAECLAHFNGVFEDDTDLRGRWDFDEGSGTSAADASGNGNDATLVNTPTWVDGLQPSNESLLATPFLAFSGRLDDGGIVDGADVCTISVAYESRLIDLERPRIRRYTDEDQKRDYASDLGMGFVTSLQDAQIPWGRG